MREVRPPGRRSGMLSHSLSPRHNNAEWKEERGEKKKLSLSLFFAVSTPDFEKKVEEKSTSSFSSSPSPPLRVCQSSLSLSLSLPCIEA